MKDIKYAYIRFYSGNVSIIPCDGIEILPGSVRLLDEEGRVLEFYRTAFIESLYYDGKEFTLLKKGSNNGKGTTYCTFRNHK